MVRGKVEKRLPAYQDRLLSDRPREQWTDVPGLEGYYWVSSFGRIRRLERWVPYPDGSEHHLPEKVLAPRVRQFANEHAGDAAFLLNIPLRVEGHIYEFQIRRLVYHCFVEPIDLNDPHILIISRNGNGLDVRPNNLTLLNRAAHTAWLQDRGRRISRFSEEHRQMGTEASIKATAREVSQYDAKGRRLRTFPSIMEASRQTGIHQSLINSAAVGRAATGGGYYWRYGRDRQFDVDRLWRERKAGYHLRTKPVIQYNLKGKLLMKYPSVKQAAAALGVHPTGISANLRGRTGTAYGFMWKYN